MKSYSLIHVLALNLVLDLCCIPPTNDDNDYEQEQDFTRRFSGGHDQECN